MTDDKKRIVAMVEASEQDRIDGEKDRADLRLLRGELGDILKHPKATGIALWTRRMVDASIDPLVIGKTMLIGDRAGGFLYTIGAKTIALAAHEFQCERTLRKVLRDGVPDSVAANMLVAGATWLAEQHAIPRATLRSLVSELERRAFPGRLAGCPGALDYVDARHVASRAWLLDAIDNAKLPAYAPLEYSKS